MTTQRTLEGFVTRKKETKRRLNTSGSVESMTETGKAPQKRDEHASPTRKSAIVVHGDLLSFSKANSIAHQTNCKSTYAKGLATILFRRFPYADVYTNPSKAPTRTPGTITIHQDPMTKGKTVVNIYGQRYPGKPTPFESTANREDWFRQALKAMAEQQESIGTVAFPFGIGCGMAGGNWARYRAMIDSFARAYGHEVYIVRLK
ncbi:swarming motility protein YbiA [Carpediemonas membranifera]|uniref:Swarming motility protein YbiA n=1 Tax=Carpediemonas membranifera TaxID=201153 RepID=A0A8J6E6E2_9EUKA|nr:swarming motility protein YbiA [Carpediemonas membranifera]|eukprot:KAG9389470.1 swarming motility protein YbiA [Carpediemonas membranifera]